MADYGNKNRNQGKQEGGGFTQFQTHTLKDKEKLLLTMSKIEDVNELNSLLENIKTFAKDMGRNLSSSQLRNVFSKIKTAKTPIDIQLLRPQLMYVAARQDRPDAKQVMEFVESLASKVVDTEGVKNFQSFMEAFVAYHKYFNPKDKN